MFSEEIEVLQRRVNDKLRELGLPHLVRIDNYDIEAGAFDVAVFPRYTFGSDQDTEAEAYDVALEFLKSWRT